MSAPDSLLEFDRAIAMLHTGVDRRRPADADKAYNNLASSSPPSLPASRRSAGAECARSVLSGENGIRHARCGSATVRQRRRRSGGDALGLWPTRAATPAASGSGSGSAWTIVEPLRRAGEGDVEGAQALDLRLDDARRLDDDDAVELEALDDADRHDRDRSSSPVAAARPWSMPAASRAADISSAIASGTTTTTLMPSRSAVIAAVAAATAPPSSVDRRHGHDVGQRVALAHRSRRPQARRRRVHHAVGELHDLRRDAVADRQPDDPARPAVGQVLGDVAPARRRPRPGGLGEVADDRERPVERPARRPSSAASA